jgi:serine O-acetyltransferase
MFFELAKETIETIFEKDPAAKSKREVIFCYPGFHAVSFHYFAHKLWLSNHRFLARFVSHVSRILTGIEIHPGATLGKRLFIDHGMGVVIGETAIVGNDCVIYQGVTLGAGQEARMGQVTREVKRHPTLGNGVVVGSGAEIQGDITVGDEVRIASGSIILKDVPAHSVVVGVPGRIVRKDGKKVENPDPEAEAIKRLSEKIATLEKTVAALKGEPAPPEAKKSVAVSVRNGEEPEKVKVGHSESGSNGNDKPNSGTLGAPIDDPIEIFLHGAGI